MGLRLSPPLPRAGGALLLSGCEAAPSPARPGGVLTGSVVAADAPAVARGRGEQAEALSRQRWGTRWRPSHLGRMSVVGAGACSDWRMHMCARVCTCVHGCVCVCMCVRACSPVHAALQGCPRPAAWSGSRECGLDQRPPRDPWAAPPSGESWGAGSAPGDPRLSRCLPHGTPSRQLSPLPHPQVWPLRGRQMVRGLTRGPRPTSSLG